MRRLLLKLFDIREGETPRALLMFSYIFLVICCLLMLKPVRNSLFLDRYSVSDIPYVYILVAISAALVTSVYARFANKVRLDILIKGSLLIIISNLLIFWLLLIFNYQGGWFLYLFYVWVAIFGVITTSQFWILANYVFDAREAKRMFGFVGAGAISGGILGGYSTYIALLIGTENILIICAALLTLCLLILQAVWKMRVQDHRREKSRQKRQMTREAVSGNPLRLLRNSRHLVYLAGIVGVGVVVANLVDYQYIAIAKGHYPGKDELTAFFGFWLSTLSIISLAIQLFLTRRILSSLGVGPSLFFLPFGILLGALAIFFYPVLWAAILIKVSDGSFKQSINKAGLEILALPIPSSIKPQAKAFIDVFIDSLATGIGGGLLILFTAGLGFSTGNISLVIIALILVWIYLIARVRNAYVEAFRTAIEKRTIDLEEHSVNVEDASVFQSFLNVLDGSNEKQIIYVLHLLENVKNERFLPYFRKLLHHHSGEIRLQALKMISQYDQENLTPEIKPLVDDKDEEVRAEAIGYLFQKSGDQDKVNVLNNFLEHPDYQVRGAALMCLAREVSANQAIRQIFDLKGLIEETLTNLNQIPQSQAQKNFTRVNIARAIGAAKSPQLYPYLQILLNDKSPVVVQAAIISAGKTRATEFVPVLIPFLESRQERKYAREALAEYGEDTLDQLDAHLNDRYENKNIRLNIPKVLGLIGVQKSVDLLIKNLEQKDLLIRFEILRALNRLRKNFPMLKFYEKPIEKKILEEIHNYMHTLTVLYSRTQCNMGDASSGSATIDSRRVNDAHALLIRALEEKLDANLERIFRLLGLRYMPKDMFNAYLGIVSQKQELRANAIEFLDNILDNDLKKYIIPIVDTNSLEALIEIGKQQFEAEVPNERTCLTLLLEDHDDWLKACTLYLIAETKQEGFLSAIGSLVNSREPIVKETAEYALRRLDVAG